LLQGAELDEERDAMEGTPTRSADPPDPNRSTEPAQDSPPTSTTEQPAAAGGGRHRRRSAHGPNHYRQLGGGTDLLHDRVSAGEDDEAFYLSFEEDRGSGFFLHSKAFRGARWAGPILEITVGGVVLRVEPESGS
jgi:hypothetical protein